MFSFTAACLYRRIWAPCWATAWILLEVEKQIWMRLCTPVWAASWKVWDTLDYYIYTVYRRKTVFRVLDRQPWCWNELACSWIVVLEEMQILRTMICSCTWIILNVWTVSISSPGFTSACKTSSTVTTEAAWLCCLCVRLRHSSVGGVTLKCCFSHLWFFFPSMLSHQARNAKPGQLKHTPAVILEDRHSLCSHKKHICVYRPPKVDLTCQFHTLRAKATRSSCLPQLGNKAVIEFGIGSSTTLSMVILLMVVRC